jgi:hypothetical protein
VDYARRPSIKGVGIMESCGECIGIREAVDFLTGYCDLFLPTLFKRIGTMTAHRQLLARSISSPPGHSDSTLLASNAATAPEVVTALLAFVLFGALRYARIIRQYLPLHKYISY